jgi:phosphoglycolate phosphatase
MTTSRRFDLIVFDWDGTLFDSTALIATCIQQACQDLGVAVPSRAEAAYVIGLGLNDALAHAAPGLAPERYPELARRYRHHYFADEHGVTLFDGVAELLVELKARQHWLAVATGKSRLGLNSALQSSELGHLFDATRTADETAGKPHPRMLLELISEFGVDAERTLMIGDTTHDLQLAANAGTAAIGVAYGAHAAEALQALAPLAVVRSVAELRDFLLQST